MADHQVSNGVIPERNSSLAAPTSTTQKDLIPDFDRLSVGLAVKPGDHDPQMTSTRTESRPLTAVAAAASLPSITPSDSQLQESLVRTADRVHDEFEHSGSVHPPSTEIAGSLYTSESSTSVDVTTATPVVHETVKVEHHEIIQKVVTKEIHEYHEYTRILPVVETALLPARHFVMTEDGRKVECALSDIPVGDTASSVTYHANGDLPPADNATPSDILTNREGVKPG